jgi:hypothetical protein
MSDSKDSEPKNYFWIVSVGAIALLCAHLALRYFGHEGLDSIAVGLAAMATLPWIAKLLNSFKFAGFEVEFRKVEAKIAIQQGDIQRLKFLFVNFLTEWEQETMLGLAGNGSYTIDFATVSSDMQGELRRLRALNLIEHNPTNKVPIRVLFENKKKRNLCELFHLTPNGKDFLKMMNESKAS